MKNRLLAAVLTVCLLISCFSFSAFAAETENTTKPIHVTALVDGIEIRAQDVNGRLYLFLPGTADLTKLSLVFNQTEDKLVARETVNVISLSKIDGEGRYSLKTTLDDGSVVRYYIMQGSALPTMYLSSSDVAEGRNWVDKSKKNEATGSMKLITTDGTSVYDGNLTQIKARGNSTFTYYPKKAYQIKLSDKTDLLGTGEKGKTWVLLANYGDATLMHDKLFKDLAADLGMPYTVSCDWVNLYYDGEYRGVYLLSEKNSVGGTGVDITDMEEAYEEVNADYGEDMAVAEGENAYGQTYLYTKNLTEVENNTGGWLIELHLQEIDEANGFYTKKGVGVNVRSPEWAGKEAMEYISEYYQAFEDAVYATDEEGNYTGYNTETGKYFYEYMEMTSLIQTFLLQELALNPDGFNSSLYFHKDVDDILYAGPIWDQDMTLGTGWTIYISSGVKDYHYLAEALVQIPEFYDAMVSYFYDTFLPEAEKWLGENGKMAETAEMLADSAAMNYIMWPYVRVGNPSAENHLWAEDTNYETVTTDMVNWVERRLNVLKKTFVKTEKPAEPETDGFIDTKGHWAEEAIDYVVENGIFNGTGKGFEPNLPMNRAMLVSTLYRLEGSPKGYSHDFADVADTAWYNDAVAWASQTGVVLGDATGFNPNGNLTREQLAVMMYRYVGQNGVDSSAQGSLETFADKDKVSSWAVEALRWAVGCGLMNGTTDTLLAPQGGATRAQVATIYQRFLTQIMK